MPHVIWQKLDYDDEIKIYGEELECYSPKKMKELYPDKDSYTIVGEVRSRNKKEAVEKIQIGDKFRKVAKPGAFSKILNKKVGYLCVGEDQYVLLLKSRLPFLILLFGLGAGIGIVSLLIWLMAKPQVLNPINPMPEKDQYVETMPDVEETAPAANDGGGSVSMIYMLEAELSLADGKIDMYFQNPPTSNHDVTLQMYIVDGENQILIAQSGRLPAATGLYTMEFIEDSALLMEGAYEALFRVGYYNPLTGERALVESDITDVTLTVTP